jgi:hypothetical protein
LKPAFAWAAVRLSASAIMAFLCETHFCVFPPTPFFCRYAPFPVVNPSAQAIIAPEKGK